MPSRRKSRAWAKSSWRVPARDGELNPVVLGAAHLAGVDRVFSIGGAQAIAALAHGTATVPAVDKIVGPGNAYVAAAKRLVFGRVGIDAIAGPSEIVVICDGKTDPGWIAMDLFSQAEHDEDAQSILISPDAKFLDRVLAAMEQRIVGLPREKIVRASLRLRGAMIEVRNLDMAVDISNRIAPEHLELSVAQPRKLLKKCATLARCSSDAIHRKRSATTAPGPITCCRLRAPRASPIRWASTNSRNAPASSRAHRAVRRHSRASRQLWPMPKVYRRMPRARGTEANVSEYVPSPLGGEG